jgi:hypothetical protein
MNMQPARREPMLFLVIALPAAAVIAAIATLFIAMAGANDTGDSRVRRVAQAQTTDLAPDVAAKRLALHGVARADANGAVSLQLDVHDAGAAVLELTLRHAANPAQDVAARLVRAGDGLYLGRLDAPRAAGAYNAELVPESGAWRLVGRFEPSAAALELGPALED